MLSKITEESGLNCPIQPRVSRRERSDIAGFTLIEVLTALFVVGVATTIFIKMYTASLDLAKSSSNYNVAAQIAEEYLVELQTNPGQFAWPNFDGKIADFQKVEQLDLDRQINVDPPTAMPTNKRAFDREANLYREFGWYANAKIHAEDSNFVEVRVTVIWKEKGKDRRVYVTSAFPRSVGEGVGL
jgi:prepilin-type N-terminal cleavage/methylation domain-containing protein